MTGIGAPTPTTSVSPKTLTVGGPQRGLTANGGVGDSQSPETCRDASSFAKASTFAEAMVDETEDEEDATR